MNYQKIYTNLISKRRLYKIDKTKQNTNIEYHHIVPISCGGKNDKGIPKNNNIKYNIIGLTLREHFFAHLLLVKIYKQKYGIKSKHYFCMLKAINLMVNNSKYKIKSSKLYESLRLQAITIGCHKTTTNRFWVTNGTKDIFLKPQQQIPDGFKIGRTINFTKQQADEYSIKIKEAIKNRIPWNKGKKNIYSEEHRRKISQNHADVSGQKNGRFGSRSMYNLQTKQRKIVHKNQIQKHLDSGWVFSKELKIFNNGEIELLDINCPIGFIKGKLKKQYTDVELEELHKKRSEIAKQANKKIKNKKWIINHTTNETLLVNNDELQHLLKCDFVLEICGNQHPKFSIKGKIKIYNAQLNKTKYIFPQELEEYIKIGYKKVKKDS